MNLRKYAKGKPCMVRTGFCNHDPETTVLAHVRISGISGMGLKAPDLLGAWCCSDCHAHCDTRHEHEMQNAFYEGVLRTQNQLIKDGKLKW